MDLTVRGSPFTSTIYPSQEAINRSADRKHSRPLRNSKTVISSCVVQRQTVCIIKWEVPYSCGDEFHGFLY
jgi:hypothetical protein